LVVNQPQVVHETIDGETILIHLGTGTYYSLDGVGAAAWELLTEGVARDELAARLGARYEADAALIERGIAAFIAELVEEGLLTASRADGAPPASSLAIDGDSLTGAAFVAPVLHKYTDMQEFMLVDPLHDVEADAGWPHVKAG
jgi:Coenzyme PQQ synthesis protein D (PqqD)